jgi:ribose transport system substrate-binding protein
MVVQDNGLTQMRPRHRWLAVVTASAFVVTACGTAAPSSAGSSPPPTAAAAPTTAATPTTAPATAPTAPKPAAATTAAPAPTVASAAKPGAAPAWCGPKQITLSVSDGFGGNNWRRITSGEAKAEASLCPSVTKYLYTDGQGDVQKSISDLNGLAAQGVQAMVVFPDAGPAMLPAIRAAYQAGSLVVPYRVDPGGQAGTDYNVYISTDFCADAKLMANWLVKALPNGGNVIYLGGPAGNSQSTTRSQCLHQVLDPTNIKLIGQQPFEVTNWDPAVTQQVITADLAKYPQIDGWATDFGAAFASSLPAFQQATRKVGVVAAEDSNAFACASQDPANGFPMMTVTSQNWMSRTAVDFAVAFATGGTPPASPVVQNEQFEDSLANPPKVVCDRSMPNDAIMSSHLTNAEQKAALGE